MKRALYCTAAMLIACNPLSANAATLIQSAGNAAVIDLSVINTIGLNVTVNSASGSGNVYGQTTTLASLNQSAGIPLVLSESLKSGIVTSKAYASKTVNGHGAPTSVTGSSDIAGVNLSLNTLLGALGLGLTANEIGSTSTAGWNKTQGFYTTGTSTLSGLSITAEVAGALVTTDLSAYVNAAPNTTLNLGALSLTFNEQTVTHTPDGIAITTNALDIGLGNYILNGSLLNGHIILGQSMAAVPEPASWSLMILGFCLIGATMRTKVRRRAFA